MPKIEESIEVQVPVQQAYNQWTQFEEFPRFMEGIQSVQQLDDTHVRWVAEIRGESREWTTEITDQQPDKKVAWKTIEGELKNDGVVLFEQVGDRQTRVDVQMDVEGDSSAENVAGDLLGIVEAQVRGDPGALQAAGREWWRGDGRLARQGEGRRNQVSRASRTGAPPERRRRARSAGSD